MGRRLKKKVAPYLNLIAACGWQALRYSGGPVLDHRFVVGVILSLDRIEARHALRSFHAFKEASADGLPSMRFYEAEYDDPQLAEAMRKRDTAMRELDEQYQRSRREAS